MQTAVIKHIFEYFTSSNNLSLFDKIYLINKEFSIELDDGEIINKTLAGTIGKIPGSTIQILLADTTIEDTEKEYIIIFQLDHLSVYALKYCESQPVNTKVYFLHNDTTWVELSNLLLARLLVGVEQLKELFVDYQPITNYQELYQSLIGFMNYEEAIQNNK